MKWISVAVVLCVAVVRAEEDLPWWQTAVFYQVYPRSFKDSDGDGIGDLKGITQKADYFKEIGVDAIWLSPINKSPMVDFGYDISDFTAIDPTFGTMDDFHALLTKLRSIDVKLVLDYVPNHSSDKHPWFQMSVNPSHPLHQEYKDFYVWRNASGTTEDGKPIPPNNWISVFSGSAWEWRDERQMFYLHKFVKEQPDLNYRNPNVVSNMTAVLNFWLDKGVDGFRMDAVQQLVEDENFPDEPKVPGTAGDTYETLQHIYEMNHPQTFVVLQAWADFIYQRVEKDGRPRAVFLEVYDTIPATMPYYGTGNRRLEFPFNFNLLTKGNFSIRPKEVKRIIEDWMFAMPKDGVANWVIGNHDQRRIADKYGPEMVDSLNLLTGVLPGIKVTYNGEEIGMIDTLVRWDESIDPQGVLLGPKHFQEMSRDPERTPMQWDNSVSAGFSTSLDTWLPVNPNYWWLNVEAQRAAPVSHLKVFQAMAKARKDPVLQRGDLKVIVPDNNTLVIVRGYNESYYTLVINMGSRLTTYTSQGMFAQQGLDMNMTVVIGTINSDYLPGVNFEKGSISITLRPKAAVLLKSGLSPTTRSDAAQLLSSAYITICSILLIKYYL